jgi:hypothetical protein
MKAYMSEQDRRTGIYKRLAAIDEAKRILADVEGNHPEHVNVKILTVRGKILAESLENFIKTLDKIGH